MGSGPTGLYPRAGQRGSTHGSRGSGRVKFPNRRDNPPDPYLLFENSDFEKGDLTNWTAVGTAFEFQPTKGYNPTARGRNQPSRHQGEYWIGTFEKYHGKPELSPGQT